MELCPYEQTQKQDWDYFCDSSVQGTFLHTRKFLAYHKDRFLDQSLIIHEQGKWLGVFPSARDPQNEQTIVSHPGLTYGGLVHQGALLGEKLILALDLIRKYYALAGYSRLVYKKVPHIYHKTAADDDSYALFRLNAKRFRCDLSSAIAIEKRLEVSSRRKRSLKKALKSQLVIEEGPHLIPRLWPILTDNLAQKHQAKPVHNLEEITHLAKVFPENIVCVCSHLEGEVIAGTLLFITPTCFHTQYIAANTLGHNLSALDGLFEYCIAKATEGKKRWFDFGISNENAGLFLNEGLYRFKSEFGGGGIVHEFFELDLKTLS